MRFFIFLFAIIALSNCTENPPQAITVAQETVTNTSPVPTPISSSAPEKIIDTTFTVDYIMGKFEPTKHPDFTEINPPYSDEKRIQHWFDSVCLSQRSKHLPNQRHSTTKGNALQ